MEFTETFCGHTCYMKMENALRSSDEMMDKAHIGASWFSKLIASEQFGVKSVSTYAESKRLGVKNVQAGSEVDLSNMQGLDDEDLSMLFLACQPVELKGLDVGVAINLDDMKPEIIINQEVFGRYNKKKVKELFAAL